MEAPYLSVCGVCLANGCNEDNWSNFILIFLSLRLRAQICSYQTTLLLEGMCGLGPHGKRQWCEAAAGELLPTRRTRRVGSPLTATAPGCGACLTLPPHPGPHLPNTICWQSKHVYLILDPRAGGKLRSCCVVAWDWSTTLRRARWSQMNVLCVKYEAWQVWHYALRYCFWPS